jgi:flagellar basal body-associated protein FliL
MQTQTTTMSRKTLTRIGIISAVLTVLVALDGIYMLVSKYHPDDTANNGFGNFHPADGTTILIAAALLLIFTAILFVLANRAQAATTPMSATTTPTVDNTQAVGDSKTATEPTK